jgi:hypothetical protein
MNRFRKIALLFCAGAVLVVAIFAVVQVGQHRRERELAETLASYQRMAWEDEGALAKVREKVSARDIPTLLKWLHRGNGPEWRREWERKLYSAIARSDEELLRKHNLPALAVCGFEVLGTKGAPAIAALGRILRSGNGEDEVLYAIAPIGEPAWEITKELASGELLGERFCGAWLLGALGMNKEESVPRLLKLATEANEHLRKTAFIALGEFPCAETERLFSEMMASGDESKVQTGAYGLHRGGEGAMKTLVNFYDSSTNEMGKKVVLEALYIRDATERASRHKSFRRQTHYRWKYPLYCHPHSEINRFIEGGHDVDALWAKVRPRVLAGEESRFDEEMKRLRESR